MTAERKKGPSDECLKAWLDSISYHLGGTKRLSHVSQVASLRKTLRLSGEVFGQLVADLVGKPKPYARQTVYQWERWTHAKELPRGYWSHYAMPRKVEKALKRFVADLAAHLSRGRYSARVAGRHEWRVTLRRVR